MGRLLLRLLINTVALWLTTLILAGHVDVRSYGSEGDTTAFVLTLILVALIFGVVNGIVGGIARVVAFPLYVLTLGLISFVVNGLLLLLVAWISGLLGFGLSVENFGWGVLGALVLAIIAWLIGILLRPFTGSTRRSR
ncbi:MAG TPA: phage holin family protein [Pseudolysinimonas sp.]|jgi:putative membrane protein|nr:phage holin family protein [Pseudolysinimonas sp.]